MIEATTLCHTQDIASMKTVLQRVKSASVTVDGQLISTIGKGLLVFAAVDKNDEIKDAESMASKVLKVKLWEDESGTKWKKNVQELGGEILCVSQFTLMATTKKGNKPDFHKAAAPTKGKELYDTFFSQVRKLYQEDRVKDGVFQAMMDVSLVNDGPVTIQIDTNPPEMKNPSGLEPPSENDTVKGHVHKTFTMPASLLE
ncbi:putative aminoacyl-tRNA hydrolase [Acrodontium crateriforme]|uniref:D-aminoacyl-tRNA deacylase n=1 Tax=Acrodontium crateriforme TaxID=150365 RepID=A0AAQ3R8E5_9PEZI|nr:putative aminoacyl-tRNA hydrolase [Acrodontium crateriforme]